MIRHQRREAKATRRQHRKTNGRRHCADVTLTKAQQAVRDVITYQLFTKPSRVRMGQDQKRFVALVETSYGTLCRPELLDRLEARHRETVR